MAPGNRECTVAPGNRECTVAPGNRECTVTPGNRECTVAPGNRECTVTPGNSKCTVAPRNRECTYGSGLPLPQGTVPQQFGPTQVGLTDETQRLLCVATANIREWRISFVALLTLVRYECPVAFSISSRHRRPTVV